MDLRELYQEVILDHNKRPRNKGRLGAPTHHAEGYNPLCGDTIVVDLIVNDGRIENIGFEGQGCAISMASASLMTESIRGKSVEEALALFGGVQAMLTGKDDEGCCLADEELSVLSGVKDFPVRIKCAILPWHALKAAIEKDSERVSTE